MKKSVLIIIVVVIVLSAVLFALHDKLSIALAKNKPSNIIYSHPCFYSDVSHESDHKLTDLLCFYQAEAGVSILCLRKQSFLNYCYDDTVITDFSTEDGHIIGGHGKPGTIPSVTLSTKLGDKDVDIRCVRAIAIMATIEHNDMCQSYRSILCCEVSDEVESMVYVTPNSVVYEPIYQEVVDGRSYYVYDIFRGHLVELSEVKQALFKID